MPGTFSVVVGTYDNVKEAELVEAQLAAKKIDYYKIDVEMAPNDVRRRILLGRFPTRSEAEEARRNLGEAFRTAVVISGSRERNRFQLLEVPTAQ